VLWCGYVDCMFNLLRCGCSYSMFGCDLVIHLSLPESGQLTTPELNSLIGHAHRRVDQLQRQLVEQSAMEPLLLEAAIDNQRAKDERLNDENVSQERQRFVTEIAKLRDAWVCFILETKLVITSIIYCVINNITV